MSEIPARTAIVFTGRPNKGSFTKLLWSCFGKALKMPSSFLKSGIQFGPWWSRKDRVVWSEESRIERSETHLQRTACGGSIMVWGCCLSLGTGSAFTLFFPSLVTKQIPAKQNQDLEVEEIMWKGFRWRTRLGFIQTLTPPPISGMPKKTSVSSIQRSLDQNENVWHWKV